MKANDIEKRKKQFLKKAYKLHKNNFDYSKINFINSYTPVTIICRKHGEFKQTPRTHISKFGKNKNYGCKKCKIDSDRISQDEFIRKANKIHNYKYDYSKTKYIDYKHPITVICKTHGEFNVMPFHHIAKKHPGKCGLCKNDKKQELFLKLAKLKHGDKYDYSKSVYTKYLNKLIITCPKHGDFMQTPNGHLAGSGCSKCSESRYEEIISNLLKSYNINFIQEFKLPGINYRWDFFIPDINLIIEYHGEQHYRSRGYLWGTEDRVKKTKENDAIKKGILISKKIPFEVIAYKDNHKVDLILFNILKKYIKYSYKNKVYRRALDLIKDNKLPLNTSLDKLEKYKWSPTFIKIPKVKNNFNLLFRTTNLNKNHSKGRYYK